MTLDWTATVQGLVGGAILFILGLVWKTYEKVNRVDVTLHGDKSEGGLADRVKVLGERLHKAENSITANTLSIESHEHRIERLEG